MPDIIDAKVVYAPIWEKDTPKSDPPDRFTKVGTQVTLACGTKVFRSLGRAGSTLTNGIRQQVVHLPKFSVTRLEMPKTYKSLTKVREADHRINPEKPGPIVYEKPNKVGGMDLPQFIGAYGKAWCRAILQAMREAEEEDAMKFMGGAR